MLTYANENGCVWDKKLCITTITKDCPDLIEYLTKNGARVCVDNNAVLKWSATNGHLDVVKFLLEKSADIHADNDYALRLSANNVHEFLKKIE